MRAFLRRHRPLLLFQTPLGILFLALLVWRVDVGEALRRLSVVNLWWALPGLLVYTASKAIHAYRWRVFLWHRKELPLGQLFGIFLMSNLANALIPLRAGDLLRVEIPRRRFGVPRAELTSSVFVVETVLDGLTFVVLVTAAIAFLDSHVLLRPASAVAAALAIGAFVGALALAHVRLPPDLEERWPARWLPVRACRWLARVIPQFLEGMASLRDIRRAPFAIGISVVAWLAEVVVYWMMGKAFGLDFTAAEALVLMVAANLIVSLPLTPWDVGPYELAVTGASVLLGATRAEASGYAVGSHVLLLVWVSITGIIAMWALDLRPRDLLPVPSGSAPEEPAGDPA